MLSSEFLTEGTSLTGPELDRLKQVSDHVKGVMGIKKKEVPFGLCAITVVAMWDEMHQPKNLKPFSCMVGEDEHVVLRSTGGEVIDPTGDQYGYPFHSSWNDGKYRSFLKLTPQDIQFIREEGIEFIIRRRIIPCPFPNSLVKEVLYHGSNSPNEFKTFNRPAHGIYVTPLYSWAKEHYIGRDGKGIVIPVYANVKKMYKPTAEEVDLFYDVDYPNISILLSKLAAKGFNCCKFGGESDSMVLFGKIEIANAIDGRMM